MNDRARPLSIRGSSVLSDWRAWLPLEKAEVFEKLSRELESNYSMFSVALNEAIELRRIGRSLQATQTIGVSAELCGLLTRPLSGMLRTLAEHAKHYGTLPNAAPLDPADFRGLKDQRSARFSGLLNKVLFTTRIQFLHKVNTLGGMVEDLERDYCKVAEDVSEETGAAPKLSWATLDADHYDLNTCLREGIVLLKSFLVALPKSQIEVFEQSYHAHVAARFKQGRFRPVTIRHRRIASIASE